MRTGSICPGTASYGPAGSQHPTSFTNSWNCYVQRECWPRGRKSICAGIGGLVRLFLLPAAEVIENQGDTGAEEHDVLGDGCPRLRGPDAVLLGELGSAEVHGQQCA